MSPILEVENLTKVFKNGRKSPVTAVDHVSFHIGCGETVGLTGASGCGKSTIAKLITRLLDPTEGEIRLNGEDITHVRGQKLRKPYGQMQMIFQSPRAAFDPRRTVGYSIEEPMRNAGLLKDKIKRQQRAAELLEQCGLKAEYAKRYPHELSGGECQRAAIARALAIKPGLLICDEAVSALDVTVQKQIMDLLKTLKRENELSFLFVSHNPALVNDFCDRVLVMDHGKIIRNDD